MGVGTGLALQATVLIDPDTGQPYKVSGSGSGSPIDTSLLATKAKQDSTIAAIGQDNPVHLTNIPIPVTDNGGSLTVDGTVALSGTSPVSLATVPSHSLLLTAADTLAMATAGNVALPVVGLGGLPVDTIDVHTNNLDNKFPLQGQASMAASLPVVVASNQTSIPVTVGNSSLNTNAPSLSVSSTAVGTARFTGLTSTATQIKSTVTRLHYFDVYNPNTSVVFLNIYNALAANVTVGTTLPIWTISIPAGASRSDYLPNSMNLSTAFTVAAVMTTSTGSTAPTSALLGSFMYI